MSSLENSLRALARAFASEMVTAAVHASADELSHTELGPRRSGDLARAPARRAKDAKRNQPTHWVHAEDFVDKLEELVKAIPGGARARELRAMLGIKKDPFLRVAALAIAQKRVRRVGFKAGIRYLPL